MNLPPEYLGVPLFEGNAHLLDGLEELPATPSTFSPCHSDHMPWSARWPEGNDGDFIMMHESDGPHQSPAPFHGFTRYSSERAGDNDELQGLIQTFNARLREYEALGQELATLRHHIDGILSPRVQPMYSVVASSPPHSDARFRWRRCY